MQWKVRGEKFDSLEDGIILVLFIWTNKGCMMIERDRPDCCA